MTKFSQSEDSNTDEQTLRIDLKGGFIFGVESNLIKRKLSN